MFWRCDCFFNPHLRTHFIDLRERERKGESERESPQVREKYRLVASHKAPDQGPEIEPTTWVCALIDRELNLQPFSVRDNALTNAATPPGLELFFHVSSY